jgi:hypothetical protein
MKKLTLGTALTSLLALTACGETDAREKHIFTVEVEVTEPNGKVQTISENCKQTFSLCQASFDLETAAGKRTFTVMADNKMVHEDEIYKKSQSLTSQEDMDRLTDSEYMQTVSLKGSGFSSSLNSTRFKDVKFDTEKWVPRTERIIQQELTIPNPALDIKRKELEAEMEKVRSQRPMTRKEADEKFLKLMALKNKSIALSMPDVKAADLKIRIY